jgi:protein gp37
VKAAEDAFGKITAKVKWLSCEPLLEPLEFSQLDVFDWVVIGGQTKPNKGPKDDWYFSLKHQARAAGIKVYGKPNLEFVEWPKEYPVIK